MATVILDFKDKLKRDDWGIVTNALRVAFPGITWASGRNINNYMIHSITPKSLFLFIEEVGTDNPLMVWGHEIDDVPGSYELFDAWDYLLNTDMDNIFDQLNESEDEFDWAREILNQPYLPRPDGKYHLILFKNKITIDEARKLLETLFALGWSFSNSINHIEDLSAKTVSSYSSDPYGYVVLKPNGKMAYGSTKSTFEKVNYVYWDETDKIYWTTH